MKHAHREIMNHQRLLHPHVVQLKEVFASPPYLALVMEFVPNGDMFQVPGWAWLTAYARQAYSEWCSGRLTPSSPSCPPPLQYVVSRRGLPESEARWFFQQLMLGMDYCHRKGGWGGGLAAECRPAACSLQRGGCDLEHPVQLQQFRRAAAPAGGTLQQALLVQLLPCIPHS